MQLVRQSIAVLLTTCLALAGCKSGSQGSGSTAKATSSGSARAPESEIAAALKAVPGNAAIVAVLNTSTPLMTAATGAGFYKANKKLVDEMHAKLKAHFERHSGLFFDQVRVVVLFVSEVSGEPDGAIIITPVTGQLKDSTKEGDWHVYSDPAEDGAVAHRGETLIIGSMASVRAARETGQGETFASSSLGKELRSAASKSLFAGVAKPPALPIPPNPISAGLEAVLLRVGADGAFATLRGNPAGLEMLNGMIEQGLSSLEEMTAAQMEASADEALEGAAGILSYYQAKLLTANLDRKLDDRTLTIRFPLDLDTGGGAITVAVIGILAAVAIPAFMKYMKKSKTSEAETFLKKAGRAAQAHFIEHGTLPDSVGLTPGPGRCCANGGDTEKCAPEAADWEHPTWRALDFAMRDPHYYAYSFEKHAGPENGFTITAVGDLDCDGMRSTFTLYGEGEQLAGDVIKSNELE